MLGQRDPSRSQNTRLVQNSNNGILPPFCAAIVYDVIIFSEWALSIVEGGGGMFLRRT